MDSENSCISVYQVCCLYVVLGRLGVITAVAPRMSNSSSGASVRSPPHFCCTALIVALIVAPCSGVLRCVEGAQRFWHRCSDQAQGLLRSCLPSSFPGKWLGGGMG